MPVRSRSRVRAARALRALAVLGATGALLVGPPGSVGQSRFGSAQAADSSAAAAPPTIILITTDDQTVEDMSALPKTRALIGDAGITFTQAISPQPLCCPARATLLSGQYAHNNGVRHNTGYFGGYGRFADYDNGTHLRENLGVWLQRSGFATGFIGKMMNRYQPNSPVPHGWTLWSPLIDRVYDGYGSTFRNDDGTRRTYADTHSADATTQRTLGFLNRTHRLPRPTFVWASYVAPHGVPGQGGGKKAVPAIRHLGQDSGARSPASRKPSYHWEAGSKPDARMQRKHHARLESLRSVDDGVARIVARLKEQGRLSNATLIFSSDNGYLMGEHGRIGKNSHYQESLRVPLLVRSPGLGSGVVREDLVSWVDLPATILDVAGATAGVPQDGLSLLPIARGAARAPETTLIQAGTSDPAKLRAYGWYFRGALSTRYTYADFWNGKEVLYDRARDPFELRNLVTEGGQAEDPRYAAVLEELRRRADELATCSGPACRTSQAPLPPS